MGVSGCSGLTGSRSSSSSHFSPFSLRTFPALVRNPSSLMARWPWLTDGVADHFSLLTVLTHGHPGSVLTSHRSHLERFSRWWEIELWGFILFVNILKLHILTWRENTSSTMYLNHSLLLVDRLTWNPGPCPWGVQCQTFWPKWASLRANSRESLSGEFSRDGFV